MAQRNEVVYRKSLVRQIDQNVYYQISALLVPLIDFLKGFAIKAFLVWNVALLFPINFKILLYNYEMGQF